MKPFLLEVAEKIFTLYSRNLDTLTLVFPNRRAALYFRKHLTGLLTKPVFAPALVTIEDFISGFSSRRVPDKLELIHRLQAVHNAVVKKFSEKTDTPRTSPEAFDKFYFWGDMLLRDFDEVDKYLVPAEHLFKDLSNQKALDSGLDFLTEEQRDFLRSFWLSFDEKDSLNKQKFLHIWRQLPTLYNAFRESLDREGLAYEGMLHREVAETIHRIYTNRYTDAPEKTGQAPAICFIGFNALTRAEERIITFFVDRGLATLYWDVDAYYMNNNTQEAGNFLREYQQHPVLGKTFLQDIPANFNTPKNINLYGAAQPVGQAKLMTQLLADKLRDGYNPEETLLVLPDEKLVMPVLHGVSAHVEKLNVTMGFPLSSTPLFNLVELLIELQINRKEDQFNHREVVALLGHPYVVAAGAAEAQAKRKEILNQNWVLVSSGFLRSAVALHRLVFQPVFVQQPEAAASFSVLVTHYLKDCIVEIGKLPTVNAFDQEYCFHFIKLLNRIAEVLHPQTGDRETPGEEGVHPPDPKHVRKQEREALKSFLRLFRQLINAEKIPFRGEPLRGLQVMGVLETRNLDFKNVFILSLNEGAFPSFNSKGSYIPFNIRKAYGLPTVEHQDAMYAYLFYRILQRAENVFLFYNSETDDLGQGEMSRYLQQLIYESGVAIERYVLHNALQPHEPVPIQIKKDERVHQALAQYCRGSRPGKTLSPSALNDYLECRLRFYFKYLARIREANQVEEDLDARVLGNFLHKVMELFYLEIIQTKGDKTIEKDDFNGYNKRIDNLIDLAFIDNYSLNPEKQVVYEGQRLVVREMVKRFIDRIIEIDKEYAPFSIEALERRDITHTIALESAGNPTVVLGGSIDRADRKGDQVRVIDYKTGKDQLSFTDVPSLFNRDGKRNKAAFQTFLYTLLYKKSMATPGVKLIPGLINRINLFNDDFTFGLWQGGEVLGDATPLLPEFEAQLKTLLEEIFDPETPFDQTQQTENCGYCPYRRLCYR